MNDEDYKLSAGVCDFGTAETNEDCLLDYSNRIKNEGNLAIYSFLVLCCVNVRQFWYQYSVFIKLFVFHMTGCGTSELSHDDKDMIDLKVEPLEVSDVL